MSCSGDRRAIASGTLKTRSPGQSIQGGADCAEIRFRRQEEFLRNKISEAL